MRIILSRKGFDGKAGGFPSPIMPCGRLLSLPIPVTNANETGIPYDDLKFDGQNLSTIINQLNPNFDSNLTAHLDPDIGRDRIENRKRGWKPAFGQVGPPQSLLNNVEEGDLFLFFGWFRHTRLTKDGLCYESPFRETHVIFGWLQVGQIFHPVTSKDCPEQVRDHPHVINANVNGYGNSNTIYIASDELTISEQGLGVRGAGTFPCFNRSLQLTAMEESARSHWCLPRWFEPERPKEAKADWNRCDYCMPFDSYAYKQCQEFVFNIPDSPEVVDWIEGLFNNCSQGKESELSLCC